MSIDEILALFRFSQQKGITMTFRAAGTSLSGQAVSDGILVDISRHWGRVTVEEDGALVRVQPGAIGAFVNTVLKPYGRRIGPDPASIDSCMMGGILANNSSGMCCGVTENAYHTIHSLTIVLPNGLVLNTGEAQAESQLLEGAPGIVSGLLDLRRHLIADSELTERVRRRYQMKNTNGYALNALLDYEKPIEILTHLMIGSEGTLGFIAEAVLHTLPNLTCKYTGMLYFKNIQEAADAIAPLRASGVRAAEIMDRASLRTVENLPGAPALLRQLPETTAAILVEYQGASNKDLDTFRRSAKQTIKNLTLIHEAEFTEEPGIQA
ncbi:MAG: FAD-binding oxidoreductase, partial [Anaerolineales bacterium]|nr:FAD-binding oxidoreductase [Anaerolineales bacterium]